MYIYQAVNKFFKQINPEYLVVGSLATVILCTGTILSSLFVKADTSTVDDINITVPMSCTIEGTGMNTHNATINNGQYNSAIGETILKAYCNDNEGFAIYAIGYTDNLNGKNVLTSSDLGSTHDIATGTAISGNTSDWAMKLSTITDPAPTYPISIQNSFDSFQLVPDTNTLVAKREAGTDIGQAAEGSTLKTTYQAYISKTQAAGTYTGQVKYTLVHPHNEPTPPDSMLDVGSTVNIKMKNLAAGTDNANTGTAAPLIKSIRMSNSLPANFEPTEANTVSTPDSKCPVYIFFDNTNDAGIMYFYTENDTVVMNPDSSYLFMRVTGLSDISGVTDWDASNVTSLLQAFLASTKLTSLSALANWDTGNLTNLSTTFAMLSGLTSLHGLEDWDTSKVTTMSYLFRQDTSLSDVSAIADWDTSNVINMNFMFGENTSLTTIDLSNWNTSKVTDMQYMFFHAKSMTSIDVSGWDTSSVVNMNSMFNVGEDWAGNGQLIEIIGLGNLDVSNVTDMTSMFYGAGNMTHYDIVNWDVSKVESFNHMFADNFKLESLDLSRWNVANLKTITNMFDDNRALTTIGDVSHWNTVSLIDASGWLNGASSFVGNNGALDLSGWNTTNLKAAEEMFRATKLQTIDLSSWTFDSITNDGWEGAGSGIYYSYGTGLDTMFKNTTQLNTVYVSQSGLNSFNTAVNNGIDITDMWSGSGASGFTVK